MIIGEAMNTYNIVLHTIKEKEYQIKLELNDDETEIISWVAVKNAVVVSASNPLSLLALIIIAETYGDQWRSVEIENLYDKILEQNVL
ncbi:MAG: hypothetical protein Q4C98_06020 [Capnocytophaga sp.]|nr:hypothetical protein [Capnocytophaga sp.]